LGRREFDADVDCAGSSTLNQQLDQPFAPAENRA
jgi:hypothetical protein